MNKTNIFSKLIRGFASILLFSALLIMSMLLPSQTLVANAATPKKTLDETFIPTRSFYPYYLSVYSSYDSDLIKGMWEKLFFEEANVYTNWSSRYYVDKSTNYVGLGGESKSFAGIRFASDKKDFDAFFGNTLVANSEFLGELLCLPGYTPVTSHSGVYSNTRVQSAMKAVVYNKMVNPKSYTYFAKAMAELTKSGTGLEYLTKGKLKNTSYNGQTFDIWMLTCLASLYEGDNSETYLNSNQVSWLKSYQKSLYDAYTGITNNATLKSLVTKYPPLYDLVARSPWASINEGNRTNSSGISYGQEFFNYVEASGHGAGSWLNAALGQSKIAGLDGISSIALLFDFSNGYCYGRESADVCANHTACMPNTQGGMATSNDNLAYSLHKIMDSGSGALTKSYIETNALTKEAYMGGEGWLTKYTIRHTKAATGDGSSFISRFAGVTRITDTNGAQYVESSSPGHGLGGSRAHKNSYATGYTSLATLPTSSKTVTIYTWNRGSHFRPLDKWYTSFDDSYDYFGFDVSSPKIKLLERGVDTDEKDVINDIDVSITKYIFDISELSKEELENGFIAMSTCRCDAQYYTDTDGGSHSGWAFVGFYDYIDVELIYPDCLTKGHIWKGQITSLNADKTSAVVSLTCEKDRAHNKTITLPVTRSVDGSFYVYKAYCPYNNLTYTMRESRNKGIASENIVFKNASNITGTEPTVVAYGRNTIYASGSLSQAHLGGIYKNALAVTKFNIREGVIKPGAKSIVLPFSYSNQLDSISVIVYNSTGKVIAEANSSYTSSIKNNTITVNFYNVPDSDFDNCYATVTASAYSINYASSDYSTPADAVAKISVPSMKINY